VEQLARHAQLGAPRKQRREAGGQDFCGDHEHQAVRHFEEAAASQDVGLALGVVGADEFVAQAEGATEVGGPGFFGDEGVGAGLDQASVNVFGAEDAAQARGGFIEDVVDIGAAAAVFFEGEGGGQA
jgi:hypothetical protein